MASIRISMRFSFVVLLSALVLGGLILQEIVLGAESNNGDKSEWRQWRGPDGSGVITVGQLPEVWDSSSPNIKWKSEIPGEGISSPIVSNGRVFLTTAYESSIDASFGKILSIVSSICLVFFSMLAVLNFRKNRLGQITDGDLTNGDKLLQRVDRLIVGATFIGFIYIAMLAILGADAFQSFVANKVHFLLWKIGLWRLNPLLTLAPGATAGIWLTSGSIALLGLAASIGCFKPNSKMRPIGSLFILITAMLLIIFTPLNQWKTEVVLWLRIIFIVPALIIVFWYSINFFRISRHKGTPNFDSPRYKSFVALPLLLAIFVFIPENILKLQTGIQRVVLCLDLQTGEILWEKSVFTAPPERKYRINSYATPTPCSDGRYIAASFGAGIACLDFEGNLLWHEKDSRYTENTRYGAATSLIMTDDAIVMVQESEIGARKSWIVAYKKESGDKLWQVFPEYARDSYSTPLLVKQGSGNQLLICTWNAVVAYDPESGERLWMEEVPIQQSVPSMVKVGDLLCVTGGTHGDKGTVVMRLSGEGRDTQREILWLTKKGVPEVASPVVYNDMLFVVTETGIMTSYDLNSGKVHWKTRLKKGAYYSSLIAGDGKVYASNADGIISVIAADKSLKIIAENDLGEGCYASPAIIEGGLLIRGSKHLYFIEKK